MTAIEFSAQSKLEFDIDRYVSMGMRRVYATPFDPSTDERYASADVIRKNLDQLVRKAEQARTQGIEVYPLFFTIHHPEGNFTLPDRYREQQNLDGSLRPGFVCFRDAARQGELFDSVAYAAKCGFERIAFDDDLRDAFCYCDEHLKGFHGFRHKSRDEIGDILNSVIDKPDYEQLRVAWYDYKLQGMKEFACKVRDTVHGINPGCRIGVFTSAKRSHDFSGRSMWEWAHLFHGEQAPTFVRLAGECYTDDTASLIRGAGWQQYTRDAFPSDVERMLEITATVRIGFRSPGTVNFETKAVVANTGVNCVHWAWADEFDELGLTEEISAAKSDYETIAEQSASNAQSTLTFFIGEKLGPYTPPDISMLYGATHDPMSVYASMALLGLPIQCSSQTTRQQPAILCAAHISRDMIRQIDDYVGCGGVAVLDAIAARCYLAYGGRMDFAIAGPRSSLAYEIGPDGCTEKMIARCPPDCIYELQSEDPHVGWTGYCMDGTQVGRTSMVLTHGQGKLIVLGYDLSRTGMMLVVKPWRKRLLAMLEAASVSLPMYWTGPAGVQVIDRGDKVGLVNYNTNPVTGTLRQREGITDQLTLCGHAVEFISLRN